jgi:uncharacterized protein with GYD domain
MVPAEAEEHRREVLMPIYICQGRYTANALKGMTTNPEDRSQTVRRLFRAGGGKLISWYLTFGEYDWMVIAEMPDERAMLSAVIAAAEGGSLTDLKTTIALTADETVQAFQEASRLRASFKSAGQEDSAKQVRSGSGASAGAATQSTTEGSRRGRKGGG